MDWNTNRPRNIAPRYYNDIPSASVAGVTIKDEGITQGTAGGITSLNFVGAGVTASAVGANSTITIPGGGGGGIPGISVSFFGTPIPTPNTQTNIDFYAYSGVTVSDGTGGRTRIDLFDPAPFVYFGDNTSTANGGAGSVTIGPNAATNAGNQVAIGGLTQVFSDNSSACGFQNTIPPSGSNCSLMGHGNSLAGGGNTDVSLTGAFNNFKDAITRCSFTGNNNYSDGLLDRVHVVGDNIIIPPSLSSIVAIGSVVNCQSSSCFISGNGNTIGKTSDNSISIFGDVADDSGNSIVLGFGSIAEKGISNVAIGFRAASSAIAGTTVGDTSAVTDDYGSAFGHKAVCHGSRGVAIGADSLCDTSSGIAIGDQAQALVSKSNIAIGWLALADSNICTAIGANSIASNIDGGCTAVGAGAQAKGKETTCFGAGATALDKNGVSFGLQIDNGESDTVIIGHTAACTTSSGVYGGGGNTIVGNQAVSDRNAGTVVIGQNTRVGQSNEQTTIVGRSGSVADNAAGSCVFGAGTIVDTGASGSSIYGQSCRSYVNGGVAFGAGAVAQPFSGVNNDSPFALNLNSDAIKIGAIIGTTLGGIRVCLNGVRYILPLMTNQ